MLIVATQTMEAVAPALLSNIRLGWKCGMVVAAAIV
jgi:hypothetical protein